MRRSTHYLTMPDGVRLAVNLWLPTTPKHALPAILRQTRYMRSVDWTWPLADRGIEGFLDPVGTTRERFVAAGYAWIDVDARGSGASLGWRPAPWWREEVSDGAAVVDWIIAQPWSNKRVGTTGVSYGGTCAEMLLANRHPAVVAAIPRFSLYDVFADVAFPGGIQLSWFTDVWSKFNRDLDRNHYHQALARMVAVNAESLSGLYRDRGHPLRARLLGLAQRPRFRPIVAALAHTVTAGVTPVEGHESVLATAIADHRANFDVHTGASDMVHRDDRVSPDFPEQTIDAFSPHAHANDIHASGAAVLSVSGWLDGAYNDAAAKRFVNGPADKRWLLIGPWDHGGRQNISPHHASTKAAFDHDGEMLRFMDAFVREGADGIDLPRVRTFSMGAERWHEGDQWPPPTRPVRLHFTGSRALAASAPQQAGASELVIANGIGTGPRSRWRSLLGLAVPLGYGDRRDLGAEALSYVGAPLPEPMTVTGNAIATLALRTDEPDGSVFVYLEDVGPSGAVTYVTEGQLRLLHRVEGAQPGVENPTGVSRTFTKDVAEPVAAGERVTCRIALHSVSYRFARGHRIRVSVTGADADHFAPIFRTGARLAILHGEPGSSIELPIGP